MGVAGLGKGTSLKISFAPHHTPIADLQRFRRCGPPRSQSSQCACERYYNLWAHGRMMYQACCTRAQLLQRWQLGYAAIHFEWYPFHWHSRTFDERCGGCEGG
jgi:hypothetical protein